MLNRSLFSKFLRNAVSHFFIVATSFVCFLYFRILNRVKIIGRKNIPLQGEGTLLVANHQSMYDSFIIGIAAYFPKLVVYPSLPPYNLAAKENFFGNWPKKTFFSLLRAIPIDRRRFSGSLLKKIVAILERSRVCLFYQGTRSFDLQAAREGAAFIIIASSPPPIVIPVHIKGTDRLFGGAPGKKGIARWLPRPPFVGRRVTMKVGPPIKFEDLLREGGKPGEIRQHITNRIVSAIQDLARS